MPSFAPCGATITLPLEGLWSRPPIRARPRAMRTFAHLAGALALVLTGCRPPSTNPSPRSEPAAVPPPPAHTHEADTREPPKPRDDAACRGCERDGDRCGTWWEDGDDHGRTVAAFFDCDPGCCP